MKTQRLLLLISTLVLAGLACNTFARPLESLTGQPTSTPTRPAPSEATATAPPTVTPRASATPTAQPTASPSPSGDLRIPNGPLLSSAAATERRLRQGEEIEFIEAYAQEEYDPAELSQAGRTYTLTASFDAQQAALWGIGWCTTTLELLEENWSHISLKFSVNSISVPASQFWVAVVPSTDGLPCRYYVTIVSDWPKSETTLEVEVTFDAQINDGLADYPAGTHTYLYTVSSP